MKSGSQSSWLTCKATKARLNAIDDILESVIGSDDPEFNQMVLQTIRMGGKKLRPSLFLLSATFGGNYGKELLFPAAALELIHVASLYHDDVMDRAELRRKSPSVNRLWGNINATQAGVHLFSIAAAILAKSGKDINRLTCRYVSDLCLGQLKEAENAYNIELQQAEHIDIIRKKTASLFELPCILGATLAGAKKDIVESLGNISRDLGIAFQLVDDLLDLKGDPVKTGKVSGTDLREGVYSYAVLYALGSPDCNSELSNLLMINELTERDISRSKKLIERSGGIKAAEKKALSHVKSAKKNITCLPEGAAKDSLQNLADFIILRDN